MFSAENKCRLTYDLVPTPQGRCSEVQLMHAMCCAMLHILILLFPLQMTLNSSIQRSTVLPGLPACLPLSVSATQTKAGTDAQVLWCFLKVVISWTEIARFCFLGFGSSPLGCQEKGFTDIHSDWHLPAVWGNENSFRSSSSFLCATE